MLQNNFEIKKLEQLFNWYRRLYLVAQLTRNQHWFYSLWSSLWRHMASWKRVNNDSDNGWTTQCHHPNCNYQHYGDAMMDAIASHVTSLTIVYSTVYSDADRRKHQSSASLTFVWGIHRGPVNSPHKWPVTRKMFSFDDVIMKNCQMSAILFWKYMM